MFDFILGYSQITVSKKDTVNAMNIIAESNIIYKKMKNGSDGISFRIPLIRLNALRRLFDNKGITDYTAEWKGVPDYIRRYRKRWGIAVGAFIFTASVIISGRVIWRVNVTGNSNISDKEIISTLDSLGCGVGKAFDDIDFDYLANDFLIKSEGISWIAVNMNGTWANVEVKEYDQGDIHNDGKYYNLIAKEDGQIVSLASKEGKPVVKINDTVLKGDLLVSAVSVIRENELVFESAEGSIYATVQRTFEVNIPVKFKKKVFTGEKTYDKSIRIFNFDINLFSNSGNPYKFYDTISSESDIYMFGVPLPLSVKKQTELQYITQDVILTEKEAKDIAVSEYREILAKTVGNDRLISKITENDFDGNVYHISCKMYCIADIAKPAEIIIKEH